VLHASVRTGVEEGGTGGADEGEGGAAVVAVAELVQRRVGGDAACDLLLASDLDGKAPSGYGRRRRGETGRRCTHWTAAVRLQTISRSPAMILEKSTTRWRLTQMLRYEIGPCMQSMVFGDVTLEEI
jgi:hypothetical protein